MILLCLLSAIIIGALIGSFLNVVIYRYNTGLSVAQGRSQCFVCGKKLSWYELIPFISFLIQKGRCRTCKTKISWQYPFVEITTSLLFLAVVYRQISLYNVFSVYPDGLLYLVLLAGYYFLIVSILVVISVYDIRHKIIPNSLVYTFIILALAKLSIFTYMFAIPLDLSGWLNIFAPILLAFPFAFLWWVSKGMWIGFGDAKLAFGIGALLGLTSGLSAIMIGFWVGAIFGISMIVIGKLFPKNIQNKIGFGSEIPFAPFLIIGVFIVLFMQIDVIGLSQLLNV
ncbi:MAG: prepilin peptidase [Minisyncoccota bacterium]